MLLRPWPTLAGFTQQFQASQELPPCIVALSEHRRVFVPTIVVKNHDCSFVGMLFLPNLVAQFRMRFQQGVLITRLKFDRR